MSSSDWIKMTDRAPTEADLPVLLWNARVPKMKYTATADALRSQLGLTCFTAWQHAPEPPREETQEDRDDQAFTEWRNSPDNKFVTAWHAALAYERAEVAKMLPYFDEVMPLKVGLAIKAIRARCGGGNGA